MANFIGTGFYSISEAARLAKVDPSTLRRWVGGYDYTYSGRSFHSPPRWQKQVKGASTSLGFLDLMEARVIGKFRGLGVRFSTLHAASAAAQKKLGVTHPFATLRLMTDGCEVFLDAATKAGDGALMEISRSQHVLEPFIRPLLMEVDFVKDVARRWWPLGKKREVVLDPGRSFGKPIVDSAAVPTIVLARAVKAEGSIPRVARWYQVSSEAVRDAVDFERALAA